MKKVKKGNDIAIYWPENKNPFFLICPWQGVHFTGIALVSIVIKKLQKGMSAEEIADFLEEDVLTIQRIYDIANTYAPEYDIEKIVQKLENTSGMKQK